MIGFFILGLILHVAAMAMPAVLRDDRLLNRAINLLNALALMCGLLFSLNSLLASQLWELRLALPMVGTYSPLMRRDHIIFPLYVPTIVARGQRLCYRLSRTVC